MPDTAIALSGGVDSSVAAALLVEAGRPVFGVTMRLGLAEIADRACCGEEEAALARRVCAMLGIPHVVIDVSTEFRQQVVEPFCDAYANGLTPNPCVTCNERVKFGMLAQRVRALGATTLATGHYARIATDPTGTWLERARDVVKDQSYFLYRVPPETLQMLEFPLADLTKDDVRRMAAERGLPTAERRESQEVCFTADHVALVGTAHPAALAPGPIESSSGAVLGQHRGLARYTVGQRKRLGVGGPTGPLQVLALEPERNALVVGPPDTGMTSEVRLARPVWRLGDDMTAAEARIRYRSPAVPVSVRAAAGELVVAFDTPAPPLAPGQSVVLYRGDRVIGGGIVPRAKPVRGE